MKDIITVLKFSITFCDVRSEIKTSIKLVNVSKKLVLSLQTYLWVQISLYYVILLHHKAILSHWTSALNSVKLVSQTIYFKHCVHIKLN